MLDTVAVSEQFEPILQKAPEYVSTYFSQKRNPTEGLSAGPIHFSHTGWAFVDISAESKPTADENYYLIYDHPFSFEADALEKRAHFVRPHGNTRQCSAFHSDKRKN